MEFKKAFTIVELLVVIVVIGILAAITTISYTGITTKATEASLQSDLVNASKQLNMFDAEHSHYPSTIDCGIADSDTNRCIKSNINTTYLYTVDNISNPKNYSMFATKNSIKYFITNDAKPKLILTVIASGGTVTDVGGFRVHTFTSDGTFVVTNGDNVEILIVAGGGGGGSSAVGLGGSGGGGAGGLVYSTSQSVSPGQTIDVTIGGGGVPGASGMQQSGSPGGNSVFGSVVAFGGGYGAKVGVNGGPGGSGGGGGYNGYTTVRLGGSGTLNQGNNGGGTELLSWAGGAGGGGAGGVGGSNRTGHAGGDRGLGLTYSISGSSVVYSTGGSGGTNLPAVSPANVGKGGDATYAGGTAYAGGSGVVIIRYPL